MRRGLDALAASNLVTSTYRRYLRSLLPIRDPALAAALHREIAQSTILTRGPILEATPPYVSGATLDSLIEEGILDTGFRNLHTKALPLERPLHRHQESAVRKASRGRNLIVATGTGSGKTESFLIPILNALLAENSAGKLGPGVRALLLYPMNALANDQLKRLRELLSNTPHITFGRYTGETPDSAQRGADDFTSLNPGSQRLSNELLSRDEMRATPPHILLTNYAMLEYLLLRPADIDLFQGDTWKFIALDEAHVYDGAKAAEVAMLLRRLRDRVAPDTTLQCFATSATVGDDPYTVVKFASELFDATFEWDSGDESRQDLVSASRISVASDSQWGPLGLDTYRELANSTDPGEVIIELAKHHGFQAHDAAHALKAEVRMTALRERLATGPTDLAELANELCHGDANSSEALSAVVTAGSRVADDSGAPALSARYHLFARATEGAFTCLSPDGPHVSLGRHEVCPTCNRAMFEFGACKRCGATYLTGTIKANMFVPRVRSDETRTWALVGDTPVLVDQDDEELENAASLEGTGGLICVTCGALYASNATTCTKPNCDITPLRTIRRLSRVHGAEPKGCLACGARGSAMVRSFDSGGEAAAAVLATALYQEQPPADDEASADQPGEGRKLLSFSDSRQAAAFFAPYLESTYATIQHRKLILDGLREGGEPGEPLKIGDLAFHVARAAGRAHVFPRRASRQERERASALWIMQEIVALDDRQSLEGLGLVTIALERDSRWTIPEPLRQLGLTDDEAWTLLAELVRSVRQQGVIDMPDGVDPRDEAFDPRRGPIYLRDNGSEPGRKVLSWLPTRGRNRRSDYMERVLGALGSEADPVEVLKGCWRFITAHPEGWLSTQTLRQIGTVRQIDHTWMELSLANRDDRFACDRCQRITAASVRGVCPTLGCDGSVHRFTLPTPELDDNHYRGLYRTMNAFPMIAKEHTAQLQSREAAGVQQQFIAGKVNLLSCSTTFELGVDVGELQSVLLRNMPPTTANYVQRAGRAGRRASSAALVLTYAQRRPHDLARYAEPESMILGQVRAPYVPLGNERIDRRHAHSVALAAYFRHAMETAGVRWTKAGDFFLGDDPPASQVRAFLSPVPEDIDRSLRAVLPSEVQREIGVVGAAWVPVLCDLMDLVQAQLSNDVDNFETRRQEAFEARRGGDVERFEKTINTLMQRDLLGYLANRNILPKYGFPVDTVELRTNYSTNPVGSKLELSRDLSAAIYEYAPGSEIVAGGLLWRSSGVYRLPGRELISKQYIVCEQCKHYWDADIDIDPACPACSTPAAKAQRYVIPEFGFVADSDAKQPGSTPPLRTWNGSTHVRSLGAREVSLVQWRTNNGGVVHARATARGELIAISEGPNSAGYLICDWCGSGQSAAAKRPRSHSHLLRNSDCTGPMRQVSLAHAYETDLLDLDFDALATPPSMTTDAWLSLLYSLLDGAAVGLELSRDDVGGTLYQRAGKRTGIVLFDTVPGGAGGVLRVGESLDTVVAAALERVERCDCGEETSCYGCLRSFSNQRYHDQLSRSGALRALRLMTSGDVLQRIKD